MRTIDVYDPIKMNYDQQYESIQTRYLTKKAKVAAII